MKSLTFNLLVIAALCYLVARPYLPTDMVAFSLREATIGDGGAAAAPSARTAGETALPEGTEVAPGLTDGLREQLEQLVDRLTASALDSWVEEDLPKIVASLTQEAAGGGLTAGAPATMEPERTERPLPPSEDGSSGGAVATEPVPAEGTVDRMMANSQSGAESTGASSTPTGPPRGAPVLEISDDAQLMSRADRLKELDAITINMEQRFLKHSGVR